MIASKQRTAAILVGTILTCATLAVAQAQRPQAQPLRESYEGGAFETIRDSRLVGVNVVRLINTAEVTYKYEHGSFATWDELYRSGAIRHSMDGLALASGPEVVPGWALTMIVSHDGKTYQLSLRNLADKQCRYSLFSDDSGLIYQGSVIGCGPGT
jgi:hypothetical protein